MHFSDYVKRLSEIFYEKINRKTGWGKNEVISEFQDAREQLLMEIIERETKLK